MTSQDYRALPDSLRPLVDEIIRLAAKVDGVAKTLADLEPIETMLGVQTDPRCTKHPKEPVSYTCKSCVDEL